MIKAVIFDIDNTLYCYDTAHAAAMEKLHAYAESQMGISAAELDVLLKAKQKELGAELGAQAAIHNRMIRYLRAMEQLHLPLHHASHMAKLYWDTLIGVSEPNPGAVECVKALKDAGYILGIGTDMTLDYQMDKLEHLGLIQYFDFVVCSEEAGAEKPDPRLFNLCVRKAGVSAEECVFVGDSLKKDVIGPMAVGLKAVWYTEKEQEEYPAVSHLAQLPALISAM